MIDAPRARRTRSQPRRRRATSGVLAAYVHELSERHRAPGRVRPERHARALVPMPQHCT